MSEKIGPMSEYETHVTVRCADAAELARLDAWAGARNLKVTHILLARGRMVSQPMLTLRDRTGHERLVPRLRAAGFDPVRVKVETVPWTTDRPGPGGGYFEHHLKLLLPAGYDRAALEALVTPHAAHLSWNARRVLDGGRHERFVTQRWRGTAAG
ncbi:ankyrin, partial [Streptomyces sp. MBRL 10]